MFIHVSGDLMLKHSEFQVIMTSAVQSLCVRGCLHGTEMNSYRYEFKISYRVYMRLKQEFIPMSRIATDDKAHALLVSSLPALVVSFRNESRTEFT